MKKKLIILLLICSGNLFAQRNDNVWVFGYQYWPGYIPAIDFYFGYPNTINCNNPNIHFFDGADECISNTSGDLQFYTDGNVIYNYLNDTLPGSTDYNVDSTSVSVFGYQPDLTKQNEVILPFPDHQDQYVIIHQCGSTWNQYKNYQPIRFSYSIVDMKANADQGKMILKNQTIFSDTLLFSTVQAVKHANGRDWWILTHRWQSDAFYECLLTPDTISLVNIQHAGSVLNTGFTWYSGQVKFSPDGSKLALARNDSSILEVFNFDRCTGNLQFQDSIHFGFNQQDTILFGCSFSPNSQFLYVSDGKNLFQCDALLQNQPLKVGSWDGAGSFNPYYFYRQYNGPDGKIYIATPGSDNLHVINNPDNADTLCNFTQHSLTLTSWHSGFLPELPNFRLGALIGSGCDTLTSVNDLAITGKNELTAFPNPSEGKLIVNYKAITDQHAELSIFSTEGKLIYKEGLMLWTNTHELNLSEFPDGIYFVELKNGNNLSSAKIILRK